MNFLDTYSISIIDNSHTFIFNSFHFPLNDAGIIVFMSLIIAVSMTTLTTIKCVNGINDTLIDHG
jgi:hypothetical protein